MTRTIPRPQTGGTGVASSMQELECNSTHVKTAWWAHAGILSGEELKLTLCEHLLPNQGSFCDCIAATGQKANDPFPKHICK